MLILSADKKELSRPGSSLRLFLAPELCQVELGERVAGEEEAKGAGGVSGGAEASVGLKACQKRQGL